MLNLKNCITKHYYNDKVENEKSDINEIATHPTNKRKICSDLENVQVKKSATLISQVNDSFAPNAESTKIINDNFLDSKSNNDEHTQIINELGLEEIDFEEPITPRENKTDEMCSTNIIENKIDDISEYRKKLMNIEKKIPLQTVHSDEANVINFNAENISISQWSKGEVQLNGKPLEVFLYLKKYFI